MEGVRAGRPLVQTLAGIADLEAKKQGMLFSLAGYSAEAVEWADRAGVALFEFAFDGSIAPVGSTALMSSRISRTRAVGP